MGIGPGHNGQRGPTMNALDLIARAQAEPMTHRVTTIYACGKTRTHDTRSAAAAENHAIGERRKIGRDLIDRETGNTARVIDVQIAEI